MAVVRLISRAVVPASDTRSPAQGRPANAEKLMALMADFAASGVREYRGPSPWVAALLTVLTPGLGHL